MDKTSNQSHLWCTEPVFLQTPSGEKKKGLRKSTIWINVPAMVRVCILAGTLPRSGWDTYRTQSKPPKIPRQAYTRCSGPGISKSRDTLTIPPDTYQEDHSLTLSLFTVHYSKDKISLSFISRLQVLLYWRIRISLKPPGICDHPSQTRICFS